MKKLLFILFVAIIFASCSSTSTNPDDNIDSYYQNKEVTKKETKSPDDIREELRKVGEELKAVGEELKSEINKEKNKFPENAEIETHIYFHPPNGGVEEYVPETEPKLHPNGWISFWSKGEKIWLSGDIKVIEKPIN